MFPKSPRPMETKMIDPNKFIKAINECNKFFAKKNWMHISDYTDIINKINEENRLQKENGKTNEENSSKESKSK